MDPEERSDVTRWVAELSGGDRHALDHLFDDLYLDLRTLARKQLARGRPGDTLSTTALVHEVYLKLARASKLEAVDRHHFFSLAARAMRQVLVDEARRRAAARRPDARRAQPLDGLEAAGVETPLEDLISVSHALGHLEQLDPELGRLVEWRVFAGLTLDEIAELRSLSLSTIKREWRKARSFLHRELEPGAP